MIQSKVLDKEVSLKGSNMNIEAYVTGLKASGKTVKMSRLKLARLYTQVQRDVLYRYADSLESSIQEDTPNSDNLEVMRQDVLQWVSHIRMTLEEKRFARECADVQVNGDTLAHMLAQAASDALEKYASTMDPHPVMTDERTESIMRNAARNVREWAAQNYPVKHSTLVTA